MSNESDASAVTVIRPTRGWRSLGVHELWEYRELLYFLVWREVHGRYRQMALGPLWILLTPLMNMVIFSVVFGQWAGISTDGLPKPVFYFTALLPWGLFAVATQKSADSLVNNLRVISKVYFPRVVVPCSAVAAGFVDFCMGFVVLAGMMAWFRILPGGAAFVLPLFLLIAVATALGVGLWLAALSVKFRDVSFGVSTLVRVWMFASPVIYPTSVVAEKIPERWLWLYRLNPMAQVIEGFRWGLLGQGLAPDGTTVASAALAVTLLVTGAYHFRRTERTIVDYI